VGVELFELETYNPCRATNSPPDPIHQVLGLLRERAAAPAAPTAPSTVEPPRAVPVKAPSA